MLIMVRINDNLTIPDGEISFEYSCSPGPGGQHVNKTSSRVTLCWTPALSESLNIIQKQRIITALGGRINNEGILRLSCHSERSQSANRQLVTDRLASMLAAALVPRKKRIKTKPSKAVNERRIQAKKQKSQVKEGRGRVKWD
ncbi:MAG: aminoacyl-tRNA hydrolase [Planctomycetes bacterium]|nr:aminoacyl-tRNA hydrolase [Planctomycetota bacterium]